ncbi:MAG: ornithine carbamoyltransferase [Candidatus Anstonellales archaeon]
MDLLRTDELELHDIEEILQMAQRLKADYKNGKTSNILQNRVLVMIFEKPSTRTRVSFEAGMAQLGGHAIFLDFFVSQISRGETMYDTGAVLGQYSDLIMARLNKHVDLEELARGSRVPVINGLTELDHPCQALADLLTMKERGRMHRNAKVVFAGDCGYNMANALMVACTTVGMDVTLACPSECEINATYLASARRLGKVEIVHDIMQAAKDADVVYTDTWVSMGQEKEREKRLKMFMPFQINRKVMEVAKKDAIFMHCLPAHRGEEVTTEVIDGPQSVVYEEAENRLHVQKALMLYLLGKKY